MQPQTDDIVTRRTGPLKAQKGWVLFADDTYAFVLWANGAESQISIKRLKVTEDTHLEFDWGKTLQVKGL